MDRRSLLKGIAGAVGATVGAFALRSGVDARESAPAGMQGRQVDTTASLMSLATQGEAHYAAPVQGATGTLVAGPFPDTTVTLERVWRIVNDPSYSGYDLRAGEPDSAFPEYDRAFPIERAVTPDGRWAYTVRDGGRNASVGFHDPYLRYVSTDIANQELTARALYVAHLARLRSGNMTLVTGPDPDTMVHTIFHPDGTASVLPSWDALPPNEMHRMMAIPRASFAEFDPAYGVVTLPTLKPINEGHEIGEIAIRIAYLREIYRRYPALAENSDRERQARLEANREPFPAMLLP